MAWEHCDKNFAIVFSLLSHSSAASVFFSPCSSSDLLWLHVQETKFTFHPGESFVVSAQRVSRGTILRKPNLLNFEPKMATEL